MLRPLGAWQTTGMPAAFQSQELLAALERFREVAHIVREGKNGRIGIAFEGQLRPGAEPKGEELCWLGSLPALYPEWLGDRTFAELHNVRFPYIVGEMANGIATARMVIAAARAGLLGSFGAAGLSLQRLEKEIDTIKKDLDGTGLPWCVNLIHSPSEPKLEEDAVRLFLAKGVQRVSASAFMTLSSNVVWFAYARVRVDKNGRIERPNQVLAKLSRQEVAEPFLRPAPDKILEELLQQGKLTREEVSIARRLPVAEDITAEADSGGHTDNRPLTVLLPVLCRLRDRLHSEYGYERPIRVGAAGGLGTPSALAAAFALGAAYVLTGSVNQAALEAGVAADAREMLAGAGFADVVMAPAADMFEQGVRVQVLKRGTLFANRGAKLYELYRKHASLEEISAADRKVLEDQIFKLSLQQVWEETRAFWQSREPKQVERADQDPKHRMALIFRWYLGKASRWPIEGTPSRAVDYQLWCGPAMGGFNSWVRGSFLEKTENRSVQQIALNLLEGAAAITRAQQFRSFGVPVTPVAFDYRPRPLH